MSGATLDLAVDPDGTLVIRPHGVLDVDQAVELRRMLVHTLRRIRPARLILDLQDLHDLDAIILGTLAASWQLGDDHRVAVFLDHATRAIADRLTVAGVPGHRLRHVGEPAGLEFDVNTRG